MLQPGRYVRHDLADRPTLPADYDTVGHEQVTPDSLQLEELVIAVTAHSGVLEETHVLNYIYRRTSIGRTRICRILVKFCICRVVYSPSF